MPIFDQGYQHWQGPLSGHAWRWLAIARHGVRVQMKNRFLRLLMLFAWLPALGLVIAVALWGLLERRSEGVLALVSQFLPPEMLSKPQAYRQTMWTLLYSGFFKTELFFLMLLAVLAGPGLISRDLRFNALPLYFARPLTRLDYFLGKLGVIGALVASVAVLPAVFAYFVGLCFFFEVRVVKDTYTVLLASVAIGLVLTLSIGTLMLALSSLTRRSLYVGIAWAGLWIVSGSVGGILTGIHQDTLRREARVAIINGWIDKHPPPQGVRLLDMGNGEKYPQVEMKPGTRQHRLAGLRPEQEKEGERWYHDYLQAQQQAWMKVQTEANAVQRHDWRPLCSYVANLERVSDALLGADAAWATVTKPLVRGNELGQVEESVPRYPWLLSAGILAALLGLSTWILTSRVKSLDRLR
jgi:ABC-type transport system involved in multi-copper enzyme maturation permease subunit